MFSESFFVLHPSLKVFLLARLALSDSERSTHLVCDSDDLDAAHLHNAAICDGKMVENIIAARC